jgi:hypothetical protein
MNGDLTIPLCLKKKRGISIASIQKAIASANPAYDTYLSIKQAKYKDVKDLLARISLPDNATFYSSLIGDASAPGGDSSDSEPEEEIEL